MGSCKVAKLQSCKVAKLQSCKVAMLQSCKVAKLQSCKVAKLQSCNGKAFSLLTKIRLQTDKQTDRQTNGRTSSLLELLVAAKNWGELPQVKSDRYCCKQYDSSFSPKLLT